MPNLIESYLLFENYKKVFNQPIQEVVKVILGNDNETFKTLEGRYTELVGLTNDYKNKFTSISESLLLTTKEKEQALDKDMGKVFTTISTKVREYYTSKKEANESFILPIVQEFRRELEKNKGSFKDGVVDFVENLKQAYTIEDIEQETSAFLDNFIKAEYRFRPVENKYKDKDYFVKRGQGALYDKALGQLLKKYQLSFDMVLWIELLSDELVEAGELKLYHEPEEFTACIATYVEDYIESFEQQQVQGQKTLQELPVKKQNFLHSLFR